MMEILLRTLNDRGQEERRNLDLCGSSCLFTFSELIKDHPAREDTVCQQCSQKEHYLLPVSCLLSIHLLTHSLIEHTFVGHAIEALC